MGEPCRCDAAMQDHLRELEALEVIYELVGHGVDTRWALAIYHARTLSP